MSASGGANLTMGLGPTNEELDRLNAQLSEVIRLQGLLEYDQCGKLILDAFFDGDVAAWKSRSPAKEASIRRLAKRPNAPYRKDALAKRIGVHVALRTHGFVKDCLHLTASHVVEVLRLDEPDQAQALRQAEQKHWSVQQLRRSVVALRRSRGERRGRRGTTEGAQLVAKVRCTVKHCLELERALAETAFIFPNELEALANELRALDSTVRRIRASVPSPLETRPSVAKGRESGSLEGATAVSA